MIFSGGCCGAGGLTNERPGTDHVITGPMRGLKKNCTRWRTHTDGHGDFMTNSAQRGRVGENQTVLFNENFVREDIVLKL